MDYREKIVNHFEPTDNWVVIDHFFEITQEYEKQPKPFREINSQVSKLFNNDATLLDGFGEFLENTYPKQYAQVIASQRALNEAHRIACETQTESTLLNLPRELRDKIWQEASSANVIHVSERPAGPAGRSKTWFGRRPKKASKYQFHTCRTPNAVQTSACPPGIGDHADCRTDRPADDVPSIRLVCKQIYLELQNDEITFYSQNAFQFADLEVAEDFLFGLSERRRESITQIRLALPYRLKEYDGQLRKYKAWNFIMNYFSNPWDRRSLHMYPRKKESKDLLKLPIYFYYSGCYYENNKHRLHKRWQVGRGNTSWDIGCNEMRLKEELKLDIAMDMTPEDQPDTDRDEWNEDEDEDGIWDQNLEHPDGWLRALLQFQDYHGLTFKLYNKDGLTSSSKFEILCSELERKMAGPTIGPRKSVYFLGGERGQGNSTYVHCVGSAS